ncbi:MAG: RNA polymerase sigma factor [Myxococcales bacterium]
MSPSSKSANPPPLPEAVGQTWRAFLEQYEPLRPELYRYCRYLTRSPWEADDLVQEALMRTFVTLGCIHQEVHNPRAWLFRIASNLWLNRLRDEREIPVATTPQPEASEADARATREAAGVLIAGLAPQERAAVVLKDVFDMSLEETADALSTSVGAVKAALHRGRGKLADPEPSYTALPAPAVLDAFCAAFNARDLERVTSLLLENVVLEFPGLSLEYGVETAKRGSLSGVLYGNPSSDFSGIAPAYREGIGSTPPRLELRCHRGEWLMLGWFEHTEGDAVRAISRVTLVGDRIAHLRTYLHAPDVLAELCKELAVPFRSSGYRYWW